MDPIANQFVVYATNDVWCDPAIDTEHSDIAAYRRTRDSEHLQFVSGVAPTQFVCQRLSATALASVIDASPHASVRRVLAVQLGCHEVRCGNEIMRPEKLTRAGATCIADDEWISVLRDRFGMATVYEIGQVICDLSALPAHARGPFSWPGG